MYMLFIGNYNTKSNDLQRLDVAKLQFEVHGGNQTHDPLALPTNPSGQPLLKIYNIEKMRMIFLLCSLFSLHVPHFETLNDRPKF